MNIRVVHLADRTDRAELFPVEMERMGFNYEIFYAEDPPGITDQAVASSCTHVHALRDIGGELLVCEDDVCFLHQGRELFDRAYKQLPEGWDMLYLGGNIHEPAERYSENLFCITKGVHCNHAILYSQKARDYILSNYEVTSNEIKAFDHWLYMFGQAQMNCFIMSPMIAFQHPGISYNGVYQDYYIQMRSNEVKNLC